MKKLLLTLMFFVPVLLFAAIGDNGVSVAPDGSTLKWEEGAWDFFIMHKSLIYQSGDNLTNSAATNPQADTCMDPAVGSTYTLTSKHIPPDANVDRAFLVWLTDVDPNNLSAPTDNSVTLTFTNKADPSITLTQEVTASKQGTVASTTIGNFEYEALNIPADTNSGAQGIYTYRVEVSEFMRTIIKMGEAAGMNSGEALYGDYNVKGLDDCSNDNDSYLKSSGLVGGWFMPFVYTSGHINPKKIYFYNGLAAYHIQTNVLTVSGFELPAEAVIKLGLVVFEGDPGLANALYVNNPEGLQISGQQDPTNFAPMFNTCNPQKTNPLLYTEMYNSVSSIFGWEDEVETCIGNPNNLSDPSNPLEFGIDADILMVDAGPTGPFYGKFNKGDTQFGLKIGANQDQVYTNLLVVSVDTKAPKFDIPSNPKTLNGREKDYCSCSTDEDAICADRPFYYTIKIQNWGENQAGNITLQDTLPPQVEYVAGTTEIATKFDSNGIGTDWTAVPDVNGGFPYATAQKLADVMTVNCDKLNEPDYCSEGMWVRFVVKPKSNLSKNEVIRNTAVITGDGVPYNSNSNIPLRLKLGKCPAIAECELPPKAQCGGVRIDNENYCSSDKDCKDGKKCVDNECVLDSNADLASNSEISYDYGTNSPDNGSAAIIVKSPSKDLVLGQFYLMSEGNKGKFYNLNEAKFKLNRDTDVVAKNFKLYKDVNGDGKVDEGDTLISTTEDIKNTYYVEFAITDAASRLTPSGIKNYFIVTTDASMAENGRNGKFNLQIENSGAFTIKDTGDVKVKGSKVDFASFRLEPAEGFVFTKGEKDPQVPSYKHFNGDHEVLQIRSKSLGSPDAINSIKVKVSYAKFGENVKSISLYIDNDKNGVQSAGDTLVKKISDFDSTTTVNLTGLSDMLSYAKDEEKYLLIKAEFKMNVGEKAKFQLPSSGGVKISTDKEIIELPISSKEFLYECDKNDPTSCGSGDEDGGCAISTIPEDSNNALYIVFAAFAALLALAGVKLFASKK